MKKGRLATWCWVTLISALACAMGAAESPDQEVTLSGIFTANGEKIELPFVYAYALEEGFYSPDDPSWKLIFVDKAIEESELDEHIWDAACVELLVTKSAKFDDEPKIQVYSQSLRLSADGGGNLSGGTYPEIELVKAGPDRFTGRVYHTEMQEFFDDTFQYDFTFDVPLSDPFEPDAPVGDPLPADGGEPGKALLGWVNALHAGDIEALKTMVPAEMAGELDQEGAADDLEFMASMTPTDMKILGGSSDGETAVLQVEGMMDGETMTGEVTLKEMEGKWMAVNFAW
ncbi:MAG: hypothetical protein ABFS37_10770 [Acidobacteriota bacterium]